MDEFGSLSHTAWTCKYHVVFIPKCGAGRCTVSCAGIWASVSQARAAEGEHDRRRAPDARSRAHDDLDPAEVRGLAGDRVHQGQERDSSGAGVRERKRNFVGQHFWARGYFVSTVGRDEQVIREYIRNQEKEDERLEQLGFGDRAAPTGASIHVGPR